MSANTHKPHKITRPLQLLAVWMFTLVGLVTSFLMASTRVSHTQQWLGALFGIAAVCSVPLIICAVFVMQTRFRSEMLDDPSYVRMQEILLRFFSTFKAESLGDRDSDEAPASPSTSPDTSNMEAFRIDRYKETCGLFLVHTWRPSTVPRQVADIIIQVHEHGIGAPVRKGITSVKYNLGPKFFATPITKTDPRDGFRLEVSAYAPMLCVAWVYLDGREEPLRLERYISFST